MIRDTATRTALLALYYVSLFVGILALPVALVAHRMGVPVPLDRLLARLGEACGRRL